MAEEEEPAWREAFDESAQRSYYYTETGETTWDKPDRYVPLNEGEEGEEGGGEEGEEEVEEDVGMTQMDDDFGEEGGEEEEGEGDSSPWREIFDENAQRSYYHNTATGETTWERPAELDNQLNSNENHLNQGVSVQEKTSLLENSHNYNDQYSSRSYDEHEANEAKLQSAVAMEEACPVEIQLTPHEQGEEKLNKSDSIMEPDVSEAVSNFIGDKPAERAPEAVKKLYSNYVGFAAMSSLVAEWIVDFAPNLSSQENEQKNKERNLKMNENEKIEDVLVDCLSTMAKSKFDPAVADRTTLEYKDMPRWLKGMTRDHQGKDLLMSLYESNTNSRLLKTCMIPILKHGIDGSQAGGILASKEIYEVFDSSLAQYLQKFRSLKKNADIYKLLEEMSKISCHSEHSFLFVQQLLHLVEAQESQSDHLELGGGVSGAATPLSAVAQGDVGAREEGMLQISSSMLQKLKHRRLRQELESISFEDTRDLKKVKRDMSSQSTKLVFLLSAKHQNMASNIAHEASSSSSSSSLLNGLFVNQAITTEKLTANDLQSVHSLLLPTLPLSFDPSSTDDSKQQVEPQEHKLESYEAVILAEEARHPRFIKLLLRYLFLHQKRQELDVDSCYHVASILAFLNSFEKLEHESQTLWIDDMNKVKQHATNLMACSEIICSASKFLNLSESSISMDTESELMDYITQSPCCSYGILLHFVHVVNSSTFLDRYHLTPLGVYLRLTQHILVSWPLLRHECLKFLAIVLNRSPGSGGGLGGIGHGNGGGGGIGGDLKGNASFMINDHQKDAITCMKQLLTLGLSNEVIKTIKDTVEAGLVDRRTGQDFLKSIDDFVAPPFSQEFLAGMRGLASSVGVNETSMKIFKHL